MHPRIRTLTTAARNAITSVATTARHTLAALTDAILGPRSHLEPGELVDVEIAIDIDQQARADRIAAHLGDALDAARAGQLARVDEPDDTLDASWGAHWCLIDSFCRLYGSPNRITVGTPHGTLTIAIGTDAALADGHGWRAHINWRWHDSRTCRNLVRVTTDGLHLTGYRLCPRRRGHTGACLDPDDPTRTPRTSPTTPW